MIFGECTFDLLPPLSLPPGRGASAAGGGYAGGGAFSDRGGRGGGRGGAGGEFRGGRGGGRGMYAFALVNLLVSELCSLWLLAQ